MVGADGTWPALDGSLCLIFSSFRADYTGQWLSATELVVTVVDPGTANPAIGQVRLAAFRACCALTLLDSTSFVWSYLGFMHRCACSPGKSVLVQHCSLSFHCVQLTCTFLASGGLKVAGGESLLIPSCVGSQTGAAIFAIRSWPKRLCLLDAVPAP